MSGGAKKLLNAAAGAAAGDDSLFVEDVFSSYLYVGNTNSYKITNGIDLDGEGGLVWIKNRGATQNNWLFSEDLGSNSPLSSNLTASAATNISNWFGPNPLYTFNNDGFTTAGAGQLQTSNNNYASWTFRKAEKFFDVVTFTGNGASNRDISHSLDATVGSIFLKRTNASEDWYVYHRNIDSNVSSSTAYKLVLNTTAARANNGSNGIVGTSTSTFKVHGTGNTNNATYVAYIFAAGDEDENIIKCGAYTTDGSGNAAIDLGFEPQWILSKRTNATGAWYIRDVARGMPVDGNNQLLYPNTSGAESGSSFALRPSATGFTAYNDAASQTNIYVAIRRPMKTPTAGTEVFTAVRPSSSGTFTAISGFPTDFTMNKGTGSGDANYTGSRLQGANSMQPQTTAAEFSVGFSYDFMDRITIAGSGNYSSWISWNFKRASGFMDVVAYTGNASYGTTAHNLTVSPELVLYKGRDEVGNWTAIYSTSAQGATSRYVSLNNTDASGNWGNAQFTATAFGKAADTNTKTYIAYLFATVADVSKVGSYTGTGNNLNVDCGFTGGARFILIKRTDSTGDWHVYDSARGITAAGTNDPYLLLNSTAAEVTNTDYIALLSSGFTVTSSAPDALNADGGGYIFLAIA